MAQKLFALMLALTITVTWTGMSAAQHPATLQVLRVFTTTVLPDKRDQLPEVVENVSRTIAAAKGVLWFKVGSDPATGEIVVVSLWSNQAEIDAFLTTDARKASIEKTSPLVQGEPSAKNYQVSEAKK